MEQKKTTTSRKKFFIWSLGILASVSAFRYFTGKKNTETNTVKMLTQDGKLVEIDKEFLKTPGEKISNEELQNWIKK